MRVGRTLMGVMVAILLAVTFTSMGVCVGRMTQKANRASRPHR